MKYLQTWGQLNESISDFMNSIMNRDIFAGYIESGGDINLKDEDGKSILILSIEHNNYIFIKYLLTYSDLDINYVYQNNNCFSYIIDSNIMKLFLQRKDLIITGDNLHETLTDFTWRRTLAVLNTGVDWKQKTRNNKYFFESEYSREDSDINDTMLRIQNDFPDIYTEYIKYKKISEFNI